MLRKYKFLMSPLSIQILILFAAITKTIEIPRPEEPESVLNSGTPKPFSAEKDLDESQYVKDITTERQNVKDIPKDFNSVKDMKKKPERASEEEPVKDFETNKEIPTDTTEISSETLEEQSTEDTTTEESTTEDTTTEATTTEETTTEATVTEATTTKEPKTKKTVSGRYLSASQANHIRQLLEHANPFRSFLNTDVNWMRSMADLKLETIAVPAAVFRKSFWTRLSQESNVPINDLKNKFGIDFDNVKMSEGGYMVDLSEQQPEGDYINLGSLLDFLIKNNINTRKLIICVGINPDVFTVAFEDKLVAIASGLFDVLKIPFKYGEWYIEKMFHDAADSAIKSLEGYAELSPTLFIGKYADQYAKDASVYAAKSAEETDNKLLSLKKTSSNLASGAFTAAREVLTLPAAECSKKNSCKRNIDMSSLNSVGSSVISAYDFVSPYATSAYETAATSLHDVGNTLGPSPSAYADLASKTMFAMTMDESSKLFKVPYVLFFADGTFMDRLLTMPQLLVDVGGDNYKPYLMVFDPLLRYSRYLFTGDYDGSLNAGVDVDVDIPAKILGVSHPIVGEELIRKETSTLEKRDADEKAGFAKEIEMVHNYNGKVPKGGYKHNLVVKGNHTIIAGRLINAPQFLMSAGGELYKSTADSLMPFLETFQILIYSNDPYFVKIQNVDKALDSAPAFVAPAASIIKAVYPVIDLVVGITYGEVGIVQIGLKVPTAISALGNLVFDLAFKDVGKIINRIFDYKPGDGGVMSMSALPYSPEFQAIDDGILSSDFPIPGGRLVRSAIPAASKKKKGIMNVYEASASFVTQISSGLLGNVLNPAKVVQSGLINFKNDPLTSFFKLMINVSTMYTLATDKQVFLQIVLGGQNPMQLIKIGISAEKILQSGIDPALLLVSGSEILPESIRSLLGTKESPNVEQLKKIGIEQEKMKTINLSYSKFIDNGLMGADNEALEKKNINLFLMINRLMRNSVVNEFKFLNLGIDFKKYLSVGLRPDYLFAAGFTSADSKTLARHKVNLEMHESLKNIGINPQTLKAKNISVENLIKNGLQDISEKQALLKFGINKEKLFKSIFAGLDNTTVTEIGIDVIKLLKSGFEPLCFISGNPKLLQLDEKSLFAYGIDRKKLANAGIDFKILMSNGLTSKLFTKFYKRGIHLQHVIFAVLSTWGLDQLVGDSDSMMSMSVNAVSTSTKLAAKPGVLGRSFHSAVNMSYWDPTGNYTKLAKDTLHKFTGGETSEADTILLFNSYMKGNKNYEKLLNLGNAVRIIAGRENASDITNPFKFKPSTLRELHGLFADLPPPTSKAPAERPKQHHGLGGFWG